MITVGRGARPHSNVGQQPARTWVDVLA